MSLSDRFHLDEILLHQKSVQFSLSLEWLFFFSLRTGVSAKHQKKISFFASERNSRFFAHILYAPFVTRRNASSCPDRTRHSPASSPLPRFILSTTITSGTMLLRKQPSEGYLPEVARRPYRPSAKDFRILCNALQSSPSLILETLIEAIHVKEPPRGSGGERHPDLVSGSERRSR